MAWAWSNKAPATRKSLHDNNLHRFKAIASAQCGVNGTLFAIQGKWHQQVKNRQ